MNGPRRTLASLLCGLMLTAPALAQPPQPGPDDRSRLERRLAEAREAMEEAAREIAQLSAELARPVVRNFRFAGQRAMLGRGIEDAAQGVRVLDVSPNGPGAAAGLRAGDVITHLDGAALVDPEGGASRSPTELLLEQMANVEPGESVEVRVLRDGTPQDLTVQTREMRPSQLLEAPGMALGRNAWMGRRAERDGRWTSMELVPLTPQLGEYFGTDEGLLVVRAPANEALGLRDGDVILEIGGREPSSPEHAMRILGSYEPGEALQLTIMRKARRETLEITMPGGR